MTMLKKIAASLAAGAAGWTAFKRWRQHRQAIDLSGRVVLITGGSRGLGLTLARRFAAEGARLALVARTQADLEKAAEELRRHGVDVLTDPGDVSDSEDAQSAVQQTVDRFGRLDVLVNNAGVIQVGPLENQQRRDVKEAMGVHFWGAHNMTEAALKPLGRQPESRIVNVASIGGQISVPHMLPYSASKFALVGYSDGVRAELARRGIRVTTVCPGLMRTGSHVNALFKGQHRREYAWFSISDAQRLLSTSAEEAARQIVTACRRGAPELTITWPARLAIKASRLAPDLTAYLMELTARLLPAPAPAGGETRREGWESFSSVSPSALTKPADEAVEEHNELRGHPPPDS